jgi:hypothetical protein
MATATKKVEGAGTLGRGARGTSEPASLEFVVHQDNGGDYHWEIVGERGESLGRSGSFASYAAAARGARRVHDGAGSARIEPHAVAERKLEAV